MNGHRVLTSGAKLLFPLFAALGMTLCLVPSFTNGGRVFAQESLQDQLSSNQGENEGPTAAELTAYPDTKEMEAGDTFMLLFHFKLKPKWHIYWRNSGDAGMPTDISVDTPDGFSVGDIRWPTPVAFETSGITTYGYSGDTVLFVPVTAPESLPEEPFRFRAQVDYLACKKKCFQRKKRATITLPGDGPPEGDVKNIVKKHREALPRPFSSLDEGRVEWTDEGVVLHGKTGSAKTVRFFPISVPGVQLGSPKTEVHDSTFSLRLPVSWNPQNAIGDQQPAVKGVIALGEGTLAPSYQVSLPLDKDSF